MSKEPYNMFRQAGERTTAGVQYEDMLVMLKALVEFYGTGTPRSLRVPQELLMYIDRDEALHIDQTFNPRTGENEYVLSIETKGRTSMAKIEPPEVEEEPEVNETLLFSMRVGRGCAVAIAVVVLLTALYIIFHIISWIVAGMVS